MCVCVFLFFDSLPRSFFTGIVIIFLKKEEKLIFKSLKKLPQVLSYFQCKISLSVQDSA